MIGNATLTSEGKRKKTLIRAEKNCKKMFRKFLNFFSLEFFSLSLNIVCAIVVPLLRIFTHLLLSHMRKLLYSD